MKKLDKKQASPVLQKKSAPMTKKDVSYKSDMIGMPGSTTRKKVEKDIKGKKVDSPAKMVREKATGEKYSSKLAMKKHEKGESKATQKKEVKKGTPLHQSKVVLDSIMREKKTSPNKMKKC